ncbi:oxygenase MpaB family protein [Rhodococcus sp. NPDC079359]|uniref:oxygenase MpaB family protein n=1 Tax=Rhodococcus sp. NPDC079359 TaxID=3154961 RepID=UPI00344B6CF7
MTGDPDFLRKSMTGLGLLAGSANVIMQLGHPAVGYGVFESRVESGQINRHPIKRTRTTLSYLAVAGMGDDETKAAYRKATNRSHAAVKSTPDSPVKYSAFDPTLQLWVAACLYRGLEDVYAALYGPPDPDTVDEMYQACHVLGSTLQMPPEMWPADRAAFEKYWDAALDDIHIDPTIRRYLHGIASATFTKPAVLHPLIGPFFRFVTTGFLPQRFRDEMELAWDPVKQRRFALLLRSASLLNRVSPPVVRAFPFNILLRDVERRIRSGRALV